MYNLNLTLIIRINSWGQEMSTTDKTIKSELELVLNEFNTNPLRNKIKIDPSGCFEISVSNLTGVKITNFFKYMRSVKCIYLEPMYRNSPDSNGFVKKLALDEYPNLDFTAIRLAFTKLNSEAIEVLKVELQVDPTITALLLSAETDEVILDPAQIRALFEVINSNNITTVEFADFNLSNPETSTALISALATNNTLTTLNLWCTELHPTNGMKALVEWLGTNNTITTLRLLADQELKIKEITAAVAIILRTNRTLTTLQLDHSHLGIEEIKILAEGLKLNETLTTLSLMDNKFGYEGIKILGNVLKENANLRTLDLSGNGIKPEDTTALVELLKVDRAIVTKIIISNDPNDTHQRNITNFCDRNRALLKNWASIALSAVNLRANKGHTFQYSCMPCFPTILKFSGIVNPNPPPIIYGTNGVTSTQKANKINN